MLSASAILQSLFSTAIGRVVPLVYQKIVRRTTVETVLRGGSVGNKPVQEALKDFEVIIGSRYGALTIPLDTFLRRLESSGVVVGLAEDAMTQRNVGLTWEAFKLLHAEVFGSEMDGKPLYEQLKASFKTSIDLLCADPALAFLLKSTSSEIIKRLDRIEASANDFTSKPVRTNDRIDIEATSLKLGKSLVSKFKDIRVETNKGAKPVSLDKIYIPSRLRN